MEEGQEVGAGVLAAVTCSPALAGLIAQLEAAAKTATEKADNTKYDNEEHDQRIRAAAFEEAVAMARQCQESSRITVRDTLKELREINESLRLIASCVSRPSAVNAFNQLRTGDKHSY